MFTIWRNLKMAQNLYIRPVARFSSYSLSEFNQLDTVEEKKLEKTNEPNALEVAFKSATNPLKILRILPSNPNDLKLLSNRTLVKALQTIAVLQVANKDTVKCNFITSHPSFEQLCRRIRKCSPIFTPIEMIRSLQSLCSLGVPLNSEISLVLLNLIRHEINQLSIEEIIQLDYVLSKCEIRSELQRAIVTSLPIVFNLQIRQQIDSTDSPAYIVKALSFIAAHKDSNMDDENIIRICNIICTQKDKISLEDAINIVYSLCAIDRFHLKNAIKLIALCLRQIFDHINVVNFDDVLKISNRLISIAVVKTIPIHFHVHSLLNKCCERINEFDMGLDVAVSLQKDFKNISFQNKLLLQYMSDKITSDVDYCRKMDLSTLFTIIQAFSNNCFTPGTKEKTWHQHILPAILANEDLAQVPSTSHVWLPFTLQLMVLNHFDQELISRVLSPSNLQNYLNRKNLSTLDLYKVLILYQTASMQPNIQLNVDMKQIDELFSEYTSQTPACMIQKHLIGNLETNSVLCNIKTKFAHWIPTLVKVNKKTMQLVHFDNIHRDKSGFISLDDIPCNENEQLVSVDAIKRYHLFTNVAHNIHRKQDISEDMIIGAFRFRKKQLQQLGLSVCEVNYRRYCLTGANKKAQNLLKGIMCTVKEPKDS